MHPTETADLVAWVEDVRTRISDLTSDLTDNQLVGPQLDIVNPQLWEIGHVAWFFEKWVIQEAAGRPQILDRSEELYDSIAIAHDTRWDLPLPGRRETLDYINNVLDATQEVAVGNPSPEIRYHTIYCVYHADMHTEAFTHTRQTHGLPFPETHHRRHIPQPLPAYGDVQVAGGTYQLGADPDVSFCFDNEKWAHPVRLKKFTISSTPVTQSEYAAFCDDGGYDSEDLWSKKGWKWRTENEVDCPLYWKKYRRKWQRRLFDKWIELESDHPVVHVSWHEAIAYCKWADRRLPTEAEWEATASLSSAKDAMSAKHLFAWGDKPAIDAAHTDWAMGNTSSVNAYWESDSAAGCRQMLGNVWEWTSTTFGPYSKFEPDPYKGYSEPWFKARKVLRGGSWATRSRVLWNTWRNFFTPDRRDIFAGFRTCAK